MSVIDMHTTVGQMVAEQPARARVFERLGIDYCCGGKRRLADVCEERGLDPLRVLDELAAQDRPRAAQERDWQAAGLAELCDHIEATHHAYLRNELPRLTGLVRKVASVHGEREPALRELEEVFDAFCMEIDSHMRKEEQVLFPMIRLLESAERLPSFHCGSVNNPIRMMEFEHDGAGDALARMRSLTQDFTPPPEACNTYRAMLEGLAVLEQDMHQHIHKENNILFPRASAQEARLAGR